MKSYGQYCGLARALDVIGDRWVLLIVRELLDGPRRYAELLDGLPGIATNLLVDRLRSMETSGLLTRQQDGRYALTSRGRAQRRGLCHGPLGLAAHAAPSQRRIPLPLVPAHGRGQVRGRRPRRGNLVVEIHSGDEPMTLISAGGGSTWSGAGSTSDIVLTGPPEGVVGVIVGVLPPAEAAARGISIGGDARKLKRLRPARRSVPATATAKAPEAPATAESSRLRVHSSAEA